MPFEMGSVRSTYGSVTTGPYPPFPGRGASPGLHRMWHPDCYL